MDNGNVRKTEWHCNKARFEYVVALVEHLISHPEPDIVPVYDYSVVINDYSKDYEISYDMMRCGILNKDERDFVDLVSDGWDRHNSLLFKKLEDGTCGLLGERLYAGIAQHPELADLLKEIVNSDRYWDIHSGNVMRHENGSYVMIDLEGFIRLPLSASFNDWIRK